MAIIIRAFIPRKIHDLAFYPRVLSVVHGPISVFHLVKAVTLRTCVSCNNTWYLVVRTFQGFPWPSATPFSVVRRVELFLWRACNFNRCLQAPKHVHMSVWNIILHKSRTHRKMQVPSNHLVCHCSKITADVRRMLQRFRPPQSSI